MKATKTWLNWAQPLLEILVILLLGLAFSAYFLAGSRPEPLLSLQGLTADTRLIALEHERLAGVLIPVEMGLGLRDDVVGIGRVPMWNPYMTTGTPLVNDAFFYLFNPFVSLPMLLAGAVQGSKIAIVINVMVAGVNMWVFGRTLGLGGVARVMTAAVYMVSGGIIGKYYNGHFQLAMSLAWPPLIFAGLWWTIHRPQRWPQALTAVAFALMFFCGNIYYILHTLLCCAVILAAHLVPRFSWRVLQRTAIAGGLALSLSMIQFLPVWSVRGFVSHATADFDEYGQFVGQQQLGLNVANFITPWSTWQHFQSVPTNLWAAVDYAYIGPTIFALIIGLLMLTLWRGPAHLTQRKAAGIAIVLAIIMMIWGAGQTEPLHWLYRNIPLLAEFRFLGRANSIAALWWIVLGGIALENLWRYAVRTFNFSAVFDQYDKKRLLRALLIAGVLWLALWAYTLTQPLSQLAFLEPYRFTSYPKSINTLVNLSLIVVLADTVLLTVQRLVRPHSALKATALRHLLGARALRFSLLALALIAITDVMYTNYPIILIEPVADSYQLLYDIAHRNEPENPVPAVIEHWSPSSFDVYYAQIRNWGINEGWLPSAIENYLIPEDNPTLLNVPGWSITPAISSQESMLAFISQNNGELVECISIRGVCADDDPYATGLYRIGRALPYAFVATEQQLKTKADQLNGYNTPPAPILSHEMDTITIRATTLSPLGQQDFLVVQETNFPGWTAYADGEQIETVSVQATVPDSYTTGFIGVPMRPGTATYTLRYEPPGFKSGALISGVTLMILLGYVAGIQYPQRHKKSALMAESVPTAEAIAPAVAAQKPIAPQSTPVAITPPAAAARQRVHPGVLSGIIMLLATGITLLFNRLRK